MRAAVNVKMAGPPLVVLNIVLLIFSIQLLLFGNIISKIVPHSSNWALNKGITIFNKREVVPPY